MVYTSHFGAVGLGNHIHFFNLRRTGKIEIRITITFGLRSQDRNS